MHIFWQVIFKEIENISTLTFNEYVSLVASFHQIDANEIDYSRYSPEQIKVMETNERFNPVSTLGLRFTKSFRHFPCYNLNYLTALFSQYNQHGTLPFSGCLSEQPNKIIEVFNVFKALINEEQQKQMKKNNKKSGKR